MGTSNTTDVAKAATLDGAALATLLAKIDPSVTQDAINGILQASGADLASAVQSVFDTLRKVILNDNTAFDPAQSQSYFDRLNAAIDGGLHGHVVSLATMKTDDVVKLAESDIGARYALSNLQSFAIVNNDAIYDQHNRDGSLFKFDPQTGERLFTDDWIRDRANFLDVKLKTPSGQTSVAVDGNQSWLFEDRAQNDANGNHLRISADAATPERAADRMIFGNDNPDGENIVGGNGNDRIYGGGGDDTIRGGAGDDYVEGGAGNDYIAGGRGTDTLLGGQGEDELDGGEGNDTLTAGSGADDLTGGKGDDRLDGGDGFDTYNIDTGDGNDVIVDSDGKGEILFDGEALTGAASAQDGTWKSADGKLTYSFAGDSQEGGVLTVEGAGNQIKIVDFKNGALGIKFGDGTPAALDGVTGAPSHDHGNIRTGMVDTGGADGSSGGGDGSSGGASDLAAPAGASGEAFQSNSVAQTSAVSPVIAPAAAETHISGGLFSDSALRVPYLSSDHIAQALATETRDTSFLVPQESAAPAVDAAAGITPMDLSNALLAFHDTTGRDALLGSEDAYTVDLDGAIAALNSGGASGADASVSTSLKQSEIGLGKIGLGKIGLER
jgi:Ca2+-binding RTX toxin-like protein